MKPLTSLLLLLTILVSCKQTPKIPTDFDYGKTENNIYANKYFDFELPVPPTWVIQDKDQVKQLNQEGQKMLAEKNKTLADQIKASEVSSATLLVVFRNKTDTITGEFNHSFTVIAENLRGITSVKKGEDYLKQAKMLMQKSNMEYRFPNEMYTAKLGNHEFDAMDVIMTIQGIDVHQTYYATIEKGFALSAIASYGTDEQKKEIADVLNGFRFH
jgi:hypothetical protein